MDLADHHVEHHRPIAVEVDGAGGDERVDRSLQVSTSHEHIEIERRPFPTVLSDQRGEHRPLEDQVVDVFGIEHPTHPLEVVQRRQPRDRVLDGLLTKAVDPVDAVELERRQQRAGHPMEAGAFDEFGVATSQLFGRHPLLAGGRHRCRQQVAHL